MKGFSELDKKLLSISHGHLSGVLHKMKRRDLLGKELKKMKILEAAVQNIEVLLVS